MIDYLLVTGKTLLFLVVIILILRIMGKRELGQLNSFDIVVFFMISELFSLSIDKPRENVFLTLVPILLIFLAQLITSYLVLKSNKLRKIIEENPTLLISDGILNIEKMRKLRYNIDDLMEQIRTSGVDSISAIQYAILESNGQLSIILKGEEKTVVPFPIIKDGEVDEKVLKIINKEEKWLEEKLKKEGYNKEDIFICILESNNNLFVIEKEDN